MTDFTVVQTPGRGRAFWLGLLVGIVAMLLAVAVLWVLGVIDVGHGKQGTNTNTANVSNENATSNAANVTNASSETAVNNQTSNLDSITSEVTNQTEKAANASPYFVDAVLAKNVDDQAHPVDETSTFSKKDDRFYVVITLREDIPADTEVGVEWFKGSSKLSDYSTKVDKGQSVAYFFATNPGDVGDYSAKVLIGGKESDTLNFSVQ
ncbi:MAG: hypothetical protein U0514_02500 [Candidatus Andersenbacteria bacterium]